MTHEQTTPEITIRLSSSADADALRRLAGRDSASVPPAPLLVAEIGDEIRAALSPTDGTVIADPFHPTAELVQMLRIRAVAAQAAARNGHELSLRRPKRARLSLRTAA